MGDLHSIAYSSLLHNSSSLGYGLHNNNNNHLGVFNADMSQYFLELESSICSGTPPFLSHFESADFSTGYLQDALFEFSSKRRRLEFDDDQKLENYTKRICRSPSHSMNYFEDYEYLSTIMANSDSISVAEPVSEEDGSLLSEMIGTKEEALSSSPETFDTTSSAQKQFSSVNSDPTATITQSDSDKGNLRSIGPRFSSADGDVDEKRRKKRLINNKKVVYPFALVKPGGTEGDLTLNDINQRILMPPSRPVRHPVGDFACRPLISSADGPGLSGKTVVALTRIHTQGRGTITIVRTRG